MHVCLSIPEIIAVICTEVAPDIDLDSTEKQDLASLAALAGTSHIFSEWALNALWSGLADIVPLLRCMPSDLWEERKVAGVRTELYLRRPIVSTDWPRFDYHAKRVRSLGFPHRFTHRLMACTPPMSSEVYRALRLSRPFIQLFPSLHNLSWSFLYGLNCSLEHICLFVGPRTCYLRLEFEVLDLAELSLIRSIPVICPHIANLVIYYGPKHGVKRDPHHLIGDTIWDVVHCYQLTKIRCNLPVSRRGLVHLASMPALQIMALDVSDLIDDSISLSLPQYAFPVLRSLKLTGKSTAFLDALPSCKLDDIKIDFVNTVNEVPLMTRFFQVLHDRCSRQSLTRIEIDFGASVVPTRLLDMSFTNLQAMIIRSYHLFKIDNDFVEAAATAWPHLRILELGRGGWGWGGRSTNVTLAGLILLARHCPDLTRLCIVVDATVVDHPVDILVPNTKFKVLDLGDSVIDDPAAVAACLSEIFPHLTSISSWNVPVMGQTATEVRMKYSGRWDEVARLLKIFAEVRQMERNKNDEYYDEAEP